MMYRYRHIVVFLLLFSYLLLGAVGHLEAFIFSGFGTNPQLLAQSKDSTPQTAKIYWTQNKHIPSSVKISVPSPAVFIPPESPHVFTNGIPFTEEETSILSVQTFSLHSSRAPPKI